MRGASPRRPCSADRVRWRAHLGLYVAALAGNRLRELNVAQSSPCGTTTTSCWPSRRLTPFAACRVARSGTGDPIAVRCANHWKQRWPLSQPSRNLSGKVRIARSPKHGQPASAAVVHRARFAGAFVMSRAGSYRAWLPPLGRVQVRNHVSCTATRPPPVQAAGPRCSTDAITSSRSMPGLRPGRSSALDRDWLFQLLQPDRLENALMRVSRPALSGRYRSSIATPLATLNEGSQPRRLDTRRLSL